MTQFIDPMSVAVAAADVTQGVEVEAMEANSGSAWMADVVITTLG